MESKKDTPLDKARQIITGYKGAKLRIMEVCGTHTHEIFKLGIRKLLPPNIELISGPGCPVCVTPADFIDEAVYLAENKQITICTFGDLVRVPGTKKSLAEARTVGAKIQVVYTPLDAVNYAENHNDEQVVFLSVGFETTTPSSCLAVRKARELNLDNFSILTANKTMDSVYLSMKNSCDAYLYPGHVCAITGTALLEKLANEENISGVVAGFTASELLMALAVTIKELEKQKPFFVNCYPRVVSAAGSKAAQKIVASMMKPCDTEWRGLGVIPDSGLQLNDEWQNFDARKIYNIPSMTGKSNPACRCGEILQGKCAPPDCPLFGKICTPEHPVGACMVSHEGSCSAFYLYGGNS